DTALYLERSKGMEGSVAAMVDLIRTIRERFPSLIIVPNNGLELLDDMGPSVDAVAAEDLYVGYDFAAKNIRRTLPEDDRHKEAFLDRFRKSGRKVLVILYGNSPDG